MDSNLIAQLGGTLPVIAAPMAGGPTTPELVLAAADAGALAFLAGGYKSASALAEQIERVRASTDLFGVNLFAPNPLPVDRAAYRRYCDSVRADAERFGVSVPEEPVEDDDQWRDKIDLLLASPVPVVSFTFGRPDPAVLTALRAAGTRLVQTVTSGLEAEQAAAGVDALAVQGAGAGGHSGTLTPREPLPPRPLTELVTEIAGAVNLPLIAAGGISTAQDVAALIGAGAQAVMVGTALLLAPEAGTSAVHRAAVADDRGATVVTHAFTGRPARGLPNRFTRAHVDDAPFGYPALHYLTSSIRRAAAAAGDPEYVNLWAGVGYRSARAQPAATSLTELAALIGE